jgi:hypothetical protein
MYHLVVFKDDSLKVRRIDKFDDKDEAIEKYYQHKSNTYCELWYSRYRCLSYRDIKKIAKLEKLSIVETEYALLVQSTVYSRLLPIKLLDI